MKPETRYGIETPIRPEPEWKSWARLFIVVIILTGMLAVGVLLGLYGWHLLSKVLR